MGAPAQAARARAAGGVRPRRRTTAIARRRRRGWLFLLPLVALNCAVIVGPSVAAVYYSFTEWDGFTDARFTGLANFRRLYHDGEFHQGLIHNLEWTAFFLTVPIAMGLVGAFLLSQIRRGRTLFRLVFFIPYVIASVVNAAIWEILLDPDQGIGSQLARIGIPWLNGVAFFGDVRLALPAVAFVDNWHFWGFLVVLFLAAMQNVPGTLYDACRVDGGGRWREFWHVTLPGIRATLVFVVVIVTIWSFLAFDYVYIITAGGPGGATDTAATLLYRTMFEYNEAGYAAAMGLTLALISVGVTLGYVALRRRGWDV